MAELEDIAGTVRLNIFLFKYKIVSGLGTRLKPMATTTGNLEVKTDRSCRLLALRSMLDKLPSVNFEVLKFIFQHFVR